MIFSCNKKRVKLTGSASRKGAQYKKYIVRDSSLSSMIRFAYESSIDSPSAYESSISLAGNRAMRAGSVTFYKYVNFSV
jgi:hypothetical protein